MTMRARVREGRRGLRFVGSAVALVAGGVLLVADGPPDDPPCASSEPERAAYTYTTDCFEGDEGAFSIGLQHAGHAYYEAMRDGGRLVVQVQPTVDKSACKDGKGVGRLTGFQLVLVRPAMLPEAGSIGRDVATDSGEKSAGCGEFKGPLGEARVLSCQVGPDRSPCTADVRPAP
jgi:hypothetical protein